MTALGTGNNYYKEQPTLPKEAQRDSILELPVTGPRAAVTEPALQRMKYMRRTQTLVSASSQRDLSMTDSFPGLILLSPCPSKAELGDFLTLLRLRLAWMPLSLIFTVICRSDKSGLRKGGFTLTACFFLGSTTYLINCATVIIQINRNLRARLKNLPTSRLWFKNVSESR